MSTNRKNLTYYDFMENLIDSSSSISPIVAILWCFYPVGILVLFELLLGGGVDDDNDDQDGGTLIPAYASVKNWTLLNFENRLLRQLKTVNNKCISFSWNNLIITIYI